MDRIIASDVAEFAKSHALDDLPENKQFEHFTSYITVRRHHARTFDTDDIVVGGNSEPSIDSIAIIVNGTLVTEPSTIDELIERNGYLEVNFVFGQADRGSHFDSSKMGTFGYGVEDFFRDEPTLPRGERVRLAAEIKDAIFDQGNKLRKKPTCRLYYATTGRWNEDQIPVARRDATVTAIESTQLFSSIDYHCYGSNELHDLYVRTKTAVTREFEFKERRSMPKPDGVKSAYIGYAPAAEFMKIISDDSGDDILGSIFDENVRDWQDYNAVNKEMRDTLQSPHRDRFALMNNGVTIITSRIGGAGDDLILENFQVVNGCQTSNVLFNERHEDLSKVFVPLRLIETEDEAVKQAIITATNRQTELTTEQLYALTDFSRQLEDTFKTYDEPVRLYYERRDGQYDRFPEINKTKIVVPRALVTAFAAMFLNDPTRVTRNYKTIRTKVGAEIFAKGHHIEPYYVAAYAAYRLAFLLRNKLKGDTGARFHILTALRYLLDSRPLPPMNRNEIKSRCEEMTKLLWDHAKSDELFAEASSIVHKVVEDQGLEFDRDNIRTEATTKGLLQHFGIRVADDRA
ncbi:AIPR family protein [Hyphomicrobium denitrificans]|nr:AIPR family protein [Hyphomicrobium denitrificans]